MFSQIKESVYSISGKQDVKKKEKKEKTNTMEQYNT